MKFPERPQQPPASEITSAFVVCGRTDLQCPARLCRWVLTFMLAGGDGRTPGYTVEFAPGWKSIGNVWTFTQADSRRRPVTRRIEEFREYRVTHSIEPNVERYGEDSPTKYYADRVTTWRGHLLAECPECQSINAIGRLAFLKHEPDVALADWSEFNEWSRRWLDKQRTVKQT